MINVMSYEEFLEKGRENQKMDVIIQRLADRYKRNYTQTLKKDKNIPACKYKELSKKAWKQFRKTKDFNIAVKKEMMERKPTRAYFNPEKYKSEAEALYSKYMEKILPLIEEERITDAVLNIIPERIKDVYPKARLIKRRFILHIGPTNSGKTYEALQQFMSADEAVYLAPLRLLALEIYENTNLSGIPCSLLTGEEEDIMEEASHISETIEMADLNHHYDIAVIDEAQMISDPVRGGGWTSVILGLCADEIHICMAPHAEFIVKKLIEYCQDEIVEIDRRERMSSLIEDPADFKFPESVQPGDALIVFSKKKVIECAAELQSRGITCSMIYGALPYDTRKAETERFAKGETHVAVATDAIGMGLNLPVKRVVFLETEKYDGYGSRALLPEEIQQIAGRAGRKGLYECGYYTAANGKEFINNSMIKSPLPISYARLSFPRILMDVDGKLSEVMKQWINIEAEPIFLKTDMNDEFKLCLWLEDITQDKALILKLIYIPFNIENIELLSIWKDSARSVIEQGSFNMDYTLSKLDYETGSAFSETNANNKIRGLELLHQKYDLIYNFVRLFGIPDRKEDDKKFLQKGKKKISQELTDTLRDKKLRRKKCSVCGRNLPFTYPFQICQPCYDEMRYRREYGFGFDIY